MDKFDKMISETLSEDDARLMRELGHEEGYFQMAFGIFKGPHGWVTWYIVFWQLVLLVGGVFCAIEFFQASDVLLAVKWGISASFLLTLSVMMKLFMWPMMQTSRLLRAFKALELKVLHFAK